MTVSAVTTVMLKGTVISNFELNYWLQFYPLMFMKHQM